MHYLTLGTVWKDEHDYALDFIKYHHYVGVEHFIILDREYHRLHEMTKHLPYVEVIHFPDTPDNIHMEGFGKLIRDNQGKTKWLACLDADQALVPVKTHNVREVLKGYEDYASLQINWHSFGSSGKMTKEPGSVYERFLMRAKSDAEINAHTQFICQPTRCLPIRTSEPHYPHLYPNEIHVNTNKEQIDGDKTVALNPYTPLSFNVPALHDILWCAHYISKSLEEGQKKWSKGRCDIFGTKMPEDKWHLEDAIANDESEERVLELWKAANK